MLETDAAVRGAAPDAQAALTALEDMSRQQPTGTVWIDAAMNLLLARMHEARGDVDRALAALRRRPHENTYGIVFLTTYLREEGRLAVLAGDIDGATDAYERYLTLRQNPDEAFRTERDIVSAELLRLIESGR